MCCHGLIKRAEKEDAGVGVETKVRYLCPFCKKWKEAVPQNWDDSWECQCGKQCQIIRAVDVNGYYAQFFQGELGSWNIMDDDLVVLGLPEELNGCPIFLVQRPAAATCKSAVC